MLPGFLFSAFYRFRVYLRQILLILCEDVKKMLTSFKMDIISVIIADDHEIFRKGLRTVLDEIHFVKVTGECENGNELLKVLKSQPVDIILMDIKMPGLNGIEATRQISELYPETDVIALTMHEEIGYFNKMMDAGAKGFLLKKTNKKQLEEAIKTVFNGEQYFAEEFQFHLPKTSEPQITKPKIRLSKRELEILELICKGFSNCEIADKLGLSQRTIDGHRSRIIDKTGAKNAPNLVLYALKNGLIKI